MTWLRQPRGSVSRIFRSLLWQFYLLSAVAIVSFVGVGVVASGIIQEQLEQRLMHDYERQQAAVAQQVAASLKSQIASFQDRLKYVAQIEEIQSLDSDTCNARVDKVIGSFGLSLGNLARLNPEGVFYCSHNRAIIGVPGANFGNYASIIINDPAHPVTMSRMTKPAGSDSYLIGIHVPVYDQQAQFLGSLGGALSVKKLAQEYLKTVKIGQSGYVAVIDDNGDIIYNPASKFVGKNRFDPELQKLNANSEEINKAFALAKTGGSSKVRYRAAGVDRFASVESVEVMPGRRWIIYGVVPVSDVVVASHQLGIRDAIFSISFVYCVILILVISSMAFYVHRRILVPLGKLARVEQAIMGGNLDERVELGRFDEIGQLASSFNAMLDQLDTYRLDLENRIKHATDKLADQLSVAERARLKDDAILSSIGEGLVVVDEAGLISNINEPAAEMLGYAPSELKGQRFLSAIEARNDKGREVDPLERPVMQALATGKPVAGYVHYVRKDGTTFPAFLTASPVVLEGKPIGVIEVFRDVSAEKALERAKDEFVSLASHQLRTPANGVKAFASMLLDGYAGQLTPQQCEFVNKVMESNDRQLRIVDDMLNVARVDAGRMHLNVALTDLGALVSDVITEQQPVIDQRQQIISFTLPAKAIVAMVDGSKLRMVVENLVSNASKYTDAGGKIAVRLEQRRQTVALSVSDTGVGLSQKDIKSKLFSKFTRIDNPLSAKVGGTGLGLYLAKKIVDLHHAQLVVKSELGKGTTFVVELPITTKGSS